MELATSTSLLRTSRRRRPARQAVIALSLAAAVVVGGVLGVIVGRSGDKPVTSVSRTVTPVITTELTVSAHDSWDEVDLRCISNSQTSIRGNYVAVASDAAGRTEVVGTWPPIPGQTAAIATPTTFPAGSITTVTIQDAQGHTLTQLTARPGG